MQSSTTYMWHLKNGTNVLTCKANRLLDIEHKLIVSKDKMENKLEFRDYKDAHFCV